MARLRTILEERNVSAVQEPQTAGSSAEVEQELGAVITAKERELMTARRNVTDLESALEAPQPPGPATCRLILPCGGRSRSL